MRLPKVESGHTLGTRLKLGLMQLILGRRAPDVVRVILYRPEFFGKAFGEFLGRAMDSGSRWSRGERELMAAFTSKLNQCPF
ncbi:MAG: hypothetical protein ACYTHK_09060 [Planctomycetota bacterium]|jgi:hypothetical protein